MTPWTTRLRRRLAAEHGFTMLLALGVLLVTALLTAAVFSAVDSDVSLTQGDSNGRQAYAAAQAGVQAYLNSLNTNASSSTWWETCSNDTGSGTVASGVTYSYHPTIGCNSGSLVGTLIDPTTGTLRMEFTGTAGTGAGSQSRTIVAGFKTVSPLSFLWYTVYETVDTSIDPSCNQFYYNLSGSALTNFENECGINWVTGDHMNGPMYTQDQFLVPAGNSPSFGRAGSTDQIASQVPSSSASAICVSSNCYGASVSNAAPNVSPQVPIPSDNSNLENDAVNHGIVLTGTTTLTVNGSTATAVTCSSSSSSTVCGAAQAQTINLASDPIIYVANAAGCTVPSYQPTNVTYQTNVSGYAYGPCGDLYVSGTYSTPLTLAAADDVIVTGSGIINSTDTDPTGTASPTGSATLGIVANYYVRIMHDGLVNYGEGLQCPNSASNPDVTIDGAILALAHSFFVDNYQCGGSPQGTLTVHGAIVQYFRGIVGTVGSSGYLKNYNYDDRLAVMLPPYLFDLQNTEWTVYRETLCSPTAPSTLTNSCSYTGS